MGFGSSIREDARIQVHTWDVKKANTPSGTHQPTFYAEAIPELFQCKVWYRTTYRKWILLRCRFWKSTPQQEDLDSGKKFLELARQKNKFSRISISKSTL